MSTLLFVGGTAWMIAAVLMDPWGRSPLAACMFLAGAAMLVVAVAR